jgi:hypothetical protein
MHLFGDVIMLRDHAAETRGWNKTKISSGREKNHHIDDMREENNVYILDYWSCLKDNTYYVCASPVCLL